MDFRWRLRRLANMTWPERVHRAREAGERAICRRRGLDWRSFEPGGGLAVIPGLADKWRGRNTPAFAAMVRAAADAALAGRFHALGVDWPRRGPADLYPAAIWRLDPISGGLWPGAELYCFDISYRAERRLGDIKYVWEFNRLQFLQPLAAAVALFEDRAALGAVEAALQSWCAANPPFRGIAWNSGIELALRVVSVGLATSLCGELLSAATMALVERFMRAHLFWLAKFPSLYSSANNHRIAETLGVMVAALMAPGAPGAARLIAQARVILTEEAARQILPDGVGAEQSLTYGAFTAELLLLANMVAAAFGMPLPGIVRERLQAFRVFVAWCCDAHGCAPAIGDDDEGRVLALGLGHEPDYPASVAGVALREGQPHWRRRLLDDSDEPLGEAPFGVKTFTEGGYTIVREQRAGRRLRLMFDHGPLGYLSIAAHGHADANAFTLSLDDEDVFVDPGTFLYHSGGVWRDWLRGAAAHNTLSFHGFEQSEIAGPFNWRRKARAWLEQVEPGADWRIAARHDGYQSSLGVDHRREIVAAADGVAIRDQLIGGGRRKSCQIVWQAAEGLEIIGGGRGWRVVHKGKPVLTIAFSAPGATQVVRGGEIGEGGWVSRRFGAKTPADRLVWRGVCPEAGLVTSLTWNDPGEG